MQSTCAATPLGKDVVASHQTPATREEYVHQLFVAMNTPLRHCKSDHGYYDFVHHCRYHEKQYLDMSDDTDKKAKHRATS
jgi:hypothetical protein